MLSLQPQKGNAGNRRFSSSPIAAMKALCCQLSCQCGGYASGNTTTCTETIQLPYFGV